MITSVDNPRIKEAARLRRSRDRRVTGLFLAEGPREVERAISAGLTVHAVYHVPDLIDWPEAEPVSEAVLRKLAYRNEPEGVVAVVEAPHWELPPGGSLYVVAVGVEKPGNLGAIVRSAAAAGADAVLVADGAVDPFNPNAIRASTAATFTTPVVEVALSDVTGLGVRIVAAVVGATVPFTDTDLRGPVALVVGSEDTGLDARWQEAADVAVSIPMADSPVDSLNTATSAALLLFEAVRQRG